jgi:integrase/recombinase XerD
MPNLLEQMHMDMVLRNLSPRTIETYTWHINAFKNYFGENVEQLGEDQIRRYLYHLKTEKKCSPSALAQAFSAIKFLYRDVLKMPMSLYTLKGPKRILRLPVVLSRGEVKLIIDAVDNLKHKLMLMVTYSAGLRVSETVHLRLTDIDSQRMLIRVEQGKGKKDRYTLLSAALLKYLRAYWRYYRPPLWLFPGGDPQTPLSISTPQRVFMLAKKKPG